MPASLTTVPVTPGSGKNIEVVQDNIGNQHPVGVIEYVDGSLNPVLVSTANALPVTTGALPVLVQGLDLGSGPLNITAADVASTSTPTLLGQVFITGAPTANSAVSYTVSGECSLYIQITGTFSATLVFERSVDSGVTWTAFGPIVAGTNFAVSNTTTPGLFLGNCSANSQFRVRATAFVSGTVVVQMRSGDGINAVHNGAPPPAASSFVYISSGAANQDSSVAKAAPGIIADIEVGNQATSARFLKIYDKATAPTSADTPIRVLTLPASGGNNPHLLLPIQCLLGIAIRITTGVAFNDTGTATTNDVNVNLGYK